LISKSIASKQKWGEILLSGAKLYIIIFLCPNVWKDVGISLRRYQHKFTKMLAKVYNLLGISLKRCKYKF
jgi:hypothetical protein